MTMHLVHPSLTTTGKRRGAKKFRNSSTAQQSRSNTDNWNKLLAKYDVKPVASKKSKFTEYVPPKPVYRGAGEKIGQSLPFTGGTCPKPAEKVYTGTAIIGIGTMHKSNAVPIFSEDQAKDISKMRR